VADLAPRWRPAQPGDPPADVVAGHVLAWAGPRPASIAGYLAVVSVAHQGAGAPSPAGLPSVRAAPHGGHRAAPRPGRGGRDAGRDAPREAGGLAHARDTAVPLLGTKAAPLTDELSRLAIASTVPASSAGADSGTGGRGGRHWRGWAARLRDEGPFHG